MGACSSCFTWLKDGGPDFASERRPAHPAPATPSSDANVPSQKQMLEWFRKPIMEKGRLMRRVQPALCRKGVRGETVVTLVKGVVTARKVIDDDTSMVVRAPTVDAELYVLSKAKFDGQYESSGKELDEDSISRNVFCLEHQIPELKSRGFKLYSPMDSVRRWVYTLTDEDMSKIKVGRFITPSGVEQCVERGNMLAIHAPEERATEIYWFNPEALSAYIDVKFECEGTLDMGRRQSIRCKDVSMEQVHAAIREYVGSTGAKQLGDTLTVCADLLHDGSGGVIVAVVHEEVLKRKGFQYDTLDGGLHTECFTQMVNNIHANLGGFKSLLSAFTAHSASDRWEHTELVKLLGDFENVAELLGKLEGQPKDGAMLLNHLGDLRGVSVLLKHSASTRLRNSAQKSHGSRHAAALGLAEWLGKLDCVSSSPSAVFVRSDGGGAKLFLPQIMAPLVCAFETWTVPTNKNMLELFKQRIKDEGRLMRKVQPALCRPGLRGERVVSLVKGVVTADRVIDDDTSMVVRAPTVDSELYALSKEQFDSTYQSPGVELDETLISNNVYFLPQIPTLKSRGFKLHSPQEGVLKWIYTLTDDDMTKLRTGSFMAPSGTVQSVKTGDMLAIPAAENEVYWFNPDALLFYIDEKLDRSRRANQLDREPTSNLSRQVSAGFLTQKEMIEIFKTRIEKSGKRMFRRKLAMIRPAKHLEHVVTVIGGRKAPEVVVADDTSVVVWESAVPDSEDYYVLSKDQFEATWETKGQEIEGNLPEDRLHRSQGFKWHVPKKNRLIWIYEVTDDDIAELQTVVFQTSWAAMLTIKARDHLALLHADNVLGFEVQLMCAEHVAMYSDCTPNARRASISSSATVSNSFPSADPDYRIRLRTNSCQNVLTSEEQTVAKSWSSA